MDQFVTVKSKSYFECDRCKINSFTDKWCPCPRGGCDAKLVDSVTTKIIIERTKNASKNKKIK